MGLKSELSAEIFFWVSYNERTVTNEDLMNNYSPLNIIYEYCAWQIEFQDVFSIMSLKYHCKANHRIIFFHISAGVISYGEKLDFVFVVLRHFTVFLSQVFEAVKVKFHVLHLVSKASNQKVTYL